jgi:hypothetical protein
MRFPNLNSGALKAAKIVLERAFEERTRHSLNIRPDARLEVGDILSIAYTATATETAMAVDVIIDSLTLNADPKSTTMSIGGREDT